MKGYFTAKKSFVAEVTIKVSCSSHAFRKTKEVNLKTEKNILANKNECNNKKWNLCDK